MSDEIKDSESLLRALFGDDWKPLPPGSTKHIKDFTDRTRSSLLSMRAKIRGSFGSLNPREQAIVLRRMEQEATASGVSGDPASMELRTLIGFMLGRLIEKGTQPEAFVDYIERLLALGI